MTYSVEVQLQDGRWLEMYSDVPTEERAAEHRRNLQPKYPGVRVRPSDEPRGGTI